MRSANPLLARLSHPIWAMVSGVLLGISMPPYGLYPLAWFALVPLLVRWSLLKHPLTVLRESYSVFLLMGVIAGFWVLLHTSITAALLSGLGLLLIPLPHAIAFTLAMLARKRFGLSVGLIALVVNVLAVEFLVSHGPYAFPWILIGHTQADALLFNQIADIGGVGLLTFGVLLLNILGLLLVRSEYRPGLVPGWRTLIALLILITLSSTAVYGDERQLSLQESNQSITVGVIQPAIDVANWSIATNGDRVDQLATLSDRMLQNNFQSVSVDSGRQVSRPDLLIWPEGSIPVFEDSERQERLYQRLEAWSQMRNVSLLTGAITSDATRSHIFNSAMLFSAEQPVQTYGKAHLLPLIEQLPISIPNPMLSAMSLRAEHLRLEAQDSSIVLNGPDYRIGTSIGLESFYGNHNREHIANGADFLISLAQNGWWGRSPGASQHLRLSRLRAIETRRPIVVATVSGSSGVVYPDGSIDNIAGWMQEEAVTRDLPLLTIETTYVRHGDWLGRYAQYPALGLLAMLALSGMARLNSRSLSNKKSSHKKRRKR